MVERPACGSIRRGAALPRSPDTPVIQPAKLLLLLPVLVLSARGQFTLDREPPGPSSRRTGLVITEIMYNPRPAPVVSTNLTYEFVELSNTKPWDEDISGFSIDGSVHYTFPPGTILRPGAFLVVARVPTLIQSRYGITNVLGPWDGAVTNRLPTDRGIVRLMHRLGAKLLEVNYADSPPWSEAADGTGHSQVLVRPSFGENDPRAWAESDSVGGSPGAADPMTADPLASVFINEWQNHSDPEDWVELYNHSSAPVDMSGAWLSDDPLTNKFRIPNGTIIPPNGFLVYSQNQLGFELFAGGETVLLWNSNQTRVIDVIDFRGASNNITTGRWPDGGPFTYCMATNTPGGHNSIPRRNPVIINEIMFNPISGNTDEEYVEIVNRSGTAVNMAGWEFVVGINYAFPTNSYTQFMPPGAHWVVARNPTNLFSIYPNLSSNNTFGPYTGTLANGGERLVLASADYDLVTRSNQTFTEKLNVIMSEVTYGDGGKWGFWSDGLGSSLELIDTEANEQLPSNWADSNDTGESQWTAIEYNGPLGETLGSPVNDSLIIMLQGLGECLIDEVEVRVDNGPNLVANGGFEGDLAGWSLQGSHDFSAIENEGFLGTKSLRIRAGSRGDNQSNRILSAPFATPVPDGPHSVSIRAKVRWLRGHPEILLRLHGSATEAWGRLSLPRRLGTPGTTNSTRVFNAGPAVYEVKHSPLLPTANESVVITARFSDRHGVVSPLLHYRIDPVATYVSVPMVDDGSGADYLSRDGIYTAVIPGQAAGEMVAFYVEGIDGLGASGTLPAQVFPKPGLDRCWPNDAVARECVVRWGEVQMPGDFGTYHLWVTAANSNRWHTRSPLNNAPMDATFIYNNSRMVYNALPLFSGSPFHRTNSTTGPAGPLRVDYVLSFPEDDAFLGSSDFVLNNPGNPDRYTVSDQSAVSESTVYKIFEGLGLPHNHRRYIHLFVNGSQRSTCYERPGNFIFEDSQQPNGDMIDEWFPNDAGGQLFKVEDWFEFDPNGFDVTAYDDADLERRTTTINGVPTLTPALYRYKFRKRSVNVGSSANDFSPIYELINAASPADNPTNATIDPDVFSTVADWEMWMRHFAVQRAIGNFDTYGWDRGKNDYLYRGNVTNFVHLPWDADYSLGLGRPANEPLFASSDPRVRAMFNTPVIVRAYWRAFSDLVAGPFSNAYLDPHIDVRVRALTNNNVNIDLDAVAAIKAYIANRRAHLLSQLGTVDAPFALSGPLSFTTTNNLCFLAGSAPVNIKAITLNGTNYPMTWNSPTSFVMRVVLHPGLNTYNLAGFDRFGAAVPGATLTVNATYAGLDPDPAQALVISEVMHSPAVAGAQFVEIVNRSGDSFDLHGWWLDGVNLTFPLGAIITNGQTIVLARNANAFRAAHGSGIPVFATFNTSLGPTQTLALLRSNTLPWQAVDAVRYEPFAPWSVPAVGQSLQLIDITQDNARVANWTAGPPTPGAANAMATTLPAFDGVWLNEVQFSSLGGVVDDLGEPSPWIELLNAGAAPVALSNYFLADNWTGSPATWAFPPDLVLAPGEHRILWADGQPAETSGTNVHTGFALTYSGRLALLRLTNGQPQLMDHLSWRRLGAGATYGSHPEGQPVFRQILSTATPGAVNTGRPVPLCINEFLANNTLGMRDPADSALDDWIELFNAGSQTIDLGNFYLTDSSGNPVKYRVPNNGQYRIAPGAYFIVWADDSASQNSPARADLHVNFRLGAGSGFIGLYAPDGITPVDTLTYGAQTADISEGRYGDGAGQRYAMTRPTPRNSNAIPATNSPPRFPAVTNAVLSPGQFITMDTRAYDPDGNTLSYTTNAASALPGSLLLGTGAYRWVIPTNQPPGDYPIEVTVTDNGVPPLGDVVSFIITVRPPATPTNNTIVAGPVIHSVASVNGQSTFTIATTVGRTYRIFYKDDLNTPGWTQLGPDFMAANPTASITDQFLAPHRFYRVMQVN
jgi:hypothetical protein